MPIAAPSPLMQLAALLAAPPAQQPQAPTTPPIPAGTAPYVKPGAHVYNTPLAPQDEMKFRTWLTQNKVPFDPNAAVSDYDMRGFYQALKGGNPKAASAIDPNDKQLHYPDYWKTPYHQTFSNESQWALPTAPHWTDDDKLIGENGAVIFHDHPADTGA